MNDRTPDSDLAAKYDTIAYAARPHPATHPASLATVATLFGLDPPAVATARVLEVGCNDGSNLVPMAVTLPLATFIGCDLAARPVAAAQELAVNTGLANVRFVECDLRELPADLGTFDYIIAHGVYSWVPAPVRDALFALAAARLAPGGILYASYNTLPGCHVRRMAWDILHYHTDRIADPRARLDAARELCAMLGEPSGGNDEYDAAMRGEFRRLSQETDSALFHDDLGVPNDPVYFHEFASHAGRHGLHFVAEAEVWRMSGGGLTPRIRDLLGRLDPIAREQYADFARLRRFRQSLLCRAEDSVRLQLSPQRIGGMYVAASGALVRAHAEGRMPEASGDARMETMRALLQWLVQRAPEVMPVDEARAWLHHRVATGAAGGAAKAIEEWLFEAYLSNMVDLSVLPPPFTTSVGERPAATPLARRQAQADQPLTNLRHERVRIEDRSARHLLALLDGTRDRAQLVDALTPSLAPDDRPTAAARVDDYLQTFASLALLLRS